MSSLEKELKSNNIDILGTYNSCYENLHVKYLETM